MTCGGHLVQHPLQAGHPEQGAQAHVSAAFVDLCGKKFHSLSGQPVPDKSFANYKAGIICSMNNSLCYSEMCAVMYLFKFSLLIG